METLKWAGLNWTGPVLKQSTRLNLYKNYSEELIRRGQAYRCFCSKERLEQLRSNHRIGYDRHCRNLTDGYANSTDRPHVVRLRMPSDSRTITFMDRVFGQISHRSCDIEDVILVKADGYPTYHFANVIDDHESNVNFVMRGSEWILSTPLHLVLYETFGWKRPDFAHLPLIIRQDGSKLSKRHADTSVNALRQLGFLPEALLNFVAFLGWTPRNIKSEIMELHELARSFDIGHVNKSETYIDMEKLKWFNKQHLQSRISTDPVSVALEVSQSLPMDWPKQDDLQYIQQVVELMKERINSVQDIRNFCSYFFIPPTMTDGPIMIQTELQARLTEHLRLKLFEEGFDDLKTVFSQACSIAPETKKSDIMLFYRWIITGTRVGAPLVDTIKLLGFEEVLRRLKN